MRKRVEFTYKEWMNMGARRYEISLRMFNSTANKWDLQAAMCYFVYYMTDTNSEDFPKISEIYPNTVQWLYAGTFPINRPYSYSQYGTGASLQSRLIRDNIFTCNFFLMSLHYKLVPVQYQGCQYGLFQNISEDCRRLPKFSEQDPKMCRS